MSGVTVDSLNADGKQPVARERLTILVMTGARTDEHCLSTEVGMGSRSHCLLGAIFMRWVISLSVAGRNVEKEAGGTVGAGV